MPTSSSWTRGMSGRASSGCTLRKGRTAGRSSRFCSPTTPNRIRFMDSHAAERLIRAYVRETPLSESHALGDGTRARVFLKLENLQETGSFKLRGAATKLLSLSAEQKSRGIVVASTGNHALATATIGRKLRIPVVIYVSEHLHPLKRSQLESLGARLHAVRGAAL